MAGVFNTHSGPFWDADGPFLRRYESVLKKRWPEAPPMPYADYDPGIEVPRPSAPYVCLMPGSLWPSKAWPQEHYRILEKRILAEGYGVVVLGTPAEKEVCDFVAGDAGLNLCGRTSLREAAAWLRGAKAAVGNDSGLSHLAAACGTAVLAIYGATDPAGSPPWGPRSLTLRGDALPCAPCFERQCNVDGHPCLAALEPDRVWESLKGLLSA
jgi:lipopolysaccharide heptosyltransferase II